MGHYKPYTIELPGATYKVEADYCKPMNYVDVYLKGFDFEESMPFYMAEKKFKKDLPDIESKIKELHADEEPCFTDDNSAD